MKTLLFILVGILMCQYLIADEISEVDVFTYQGKESTTKEFWIITLYESKIRIIIHEKRGGEVRNEFVGTYAWLDAKKSLKFFPTAKGDELFPFITEYGYIVEIGGAEDKWAVKFVCSDHLGRDRLIMK